MHLDGMLLSQMAALGVHCFNHSVQLATDQSIRTTAGPYSSNRCRMFVVPNPRILPSNSAIAILGIANVYNASAFAITFHLIAFMGAAGAG